ncbi:hypothetical protein MHBO_002325 [Bonamia ostreae]|uniref:LAGLIDADG homing endonuclease n=1 Tax=Bonamia ostreae TaxID=126728 RepID=A0ABV2AMF2_9EUKA
MFSKTFKQTKNPIKFLCVKKNSKTFCTKEPIEYKYNKTIYELKKQPFVNIYAVMFLAAIGIFDFKKMAIRQIWKSRTSDEFEKNLKNQNKALTTTFCVLFIISFRTVIAQFMRRGMNIKRVNLIMPSFEKSKNNVKNSFLQFFINSLFIKIFLFAKSALRK